MDFKDSTHHQTASVRRQEIIGLAAGIDAEPATIDYTEQEHAVWRIVSQTLDPLWEQHAAKQVLAASDQLALPQDRVPQLTEVSDRLQSLSGFVFRAAGGLVDKEDFFGALADETFLSTQYVRDSGSPLYTEEPDVIHEVIGHATMLADPDLAELHRLAGRALKKVTTERAKQFVADVWWFSGEFGVVIENNELRALGAGLLSSAGELSHFAHGAEIRPLDIVDMGQTGYRIDTFQKILFAGTSVAHVLDVVGGFFAEVDDNQFAGDP